MHAMHSELQVVHEPGLSNLHHSARVISNHEQVCMLVLEQDRGLFDHGLQRGNMKTVWLMLQLLKMSDPTLGDMVMKFPF